MLHALLQVQPVMALAQWGQSHRKPRYNLSRAPSASCKRLPVLTEEELKARL